MFRFCCNIEENKVTNEEEEEDPTRCNLVFYYTYDMLNMFRPPLCPSSGAHGLKAAVAVFIPDT
jgi:hypothetical protein